MGFNRVEVIRGFDSGPERSIPVTQQNQTRLVQLRRHAVAAALHHGENVDLIDMSDMMQGRGRLSRRFGDKAVKVVVPTPGSDTGITTIYLRGVYLALDQHDRIVLADDRRRRVVDPDSDIWVSYVSPLNFIRTYSINVSGTEESLEATTHNAPAHVYEAMLTGRT